MDGASRSISGRFCWLKPWLHVTHTDIFYTKHLAHMKALSSKRGLQTQNDIKRSLQETTEEPLDEHVRWLCFDRTILNCTERYWNVPVVPPVVPPVDLILMFKVLIPAAGFSTSSWWSCGRRYYVWVESAAGRPLPHAPPLHPGAGAEASGAEEVAPAEDQLQIQAYIQPGPAVDGATCNIWGNRTHW